MYNRAHTSVQGEAFGRQGQAGMVVIGVRVWCEGCQCGSVEHEGVGVRVINMQVLDMRV